MKKATHEKNISGRKKFRLAGIITVLVLVFAYARLSTVSVEREIVLSADGKVEVIYIYPFLKLDAKDISPYADIEAISKLKFNHIEQGTPTVKITFVAPLVRLKNLDGENVNHYRHNITKIEVNAPVDQLRFVNAFE